MPMPTDRATLRSPAKAFSPLIWLTVAGLITTVALMMAPGF